MARGLVERTQRWIYAYDRFKARNPEQFDEVPAGALLESAAVDLADAAIDALRMIHRHDTLAERVSERAAKQLATNACSSEQMAPEAAPQAVRGVC